MHKLIAIDLDGTLLNSYGQISKSNKDTIKEAIKNKKILYNKFIDKLKALQIVKICEENSIYYNVYTESLILTKTLNYNVLVYNYENQNKPEGQKTSIKILDNVYKYIEQTADINILKITICDNNNIIFGSIIRKLRDIKDIDVLDVEH